MKKTLVILINLDRSPQRLRNMAGQLETLGLHWERLPAVDGRELTLENASLIDVAGFNQKHGKMPLPGELGCYLSHVKAFKRLLDTDYENALILEDDAVLGLELPRILELLVSGPPDWDMVKLSGMHRGHPLTLRTLDSDYRLAVGLTRFTGASCYLVNRKAAQASMNDMLPMSLPYDLEYDRGWKRDLRVRMVLPSPCEHSFAMGSELHPPGVSRPNFHWTRRLKTYAWRIKNDVARLFYGLQQWWHWRLR